MSFLLRVLIAAVTVVLLARPAAAQLSVGPLVLDTVPGTVMIANDGARPLRLALRLADFEQRPEGGVDIRPLGTGTRTCGKDAEFAPSLVRLEPHSRQQVSVRIRPGGGTCWVMLVVEGSLDERPGGTIGVKAYRVEPGAARAAMVSGMAQEGSGVRIAVRNVGDAPLRPRGELVLRSEDGQTVATETIHAFTVHPGEEGWVRVELPASLAPGRYVALGVLDVGTADLAAGETTVEVSAKPPVRPGGTR